MTSMRLSISAAFRCSEASKSNEQFTTAALFSPITLQFPFSIMPRLGLTFLMIKCLQSRPGSCKSTALVSHDAEGRDEVNCALAGVKPNHMQDCSIA